MCAALSKQHRGQRNLETQKKRVKHQNDLQLAHSVVLDWSYHDQLKVVGEIVFEKSRLTMCEEQIILKLGYVPQAALSHDFGEVLNYQ